MLIYISSIKNHFCLGLSRVYKTFFSGSKQFCIIKLLDKYQGPCVFVYDQNYALAIVTHPKKENSRSVLPGRLCVHILFKGTQQFLSVFKQFQRTNFLDKCQGAFVCVYDQNYSLVIVIQPIKAGLGTRFAIKTQCSFLIQVYIPIFVWV